MEGVTILWKGTVAPLNISIESADGHTMDEYDFMVEFFTSAFQPLVLTKADGFRQDANNYVFLVDTTAVGTGQLQCKVTAMLPYPSMPDGLRPEVLKFKTDYIILQ